MALPIRVRKDPSPIPVATYCGFSKDFIVGGLQAINDDMLLGTLKQVSEFGPSGAAVLGYLPDVVKVVEVETSPEVRCTALAAIGDMGEVAVKEAEYVLSLFDDEDTSVACAAIRAVGAMGPAAMEHAPEVVGFLQDEAPEFRAAAAESLGLMKAWAYNDELRPCLDDSEASVVAAAVGAIGSMGEDGQQLAGEVARHAQHSDAGVRMQVIKALTKIGDAGERQASEVAVLLADEDNMIREATVSFFKAGGTGTKKAADAVAEHLSSKNGRVQAAAAMALGHMKADKHAKDVAKLLSAAYKEDTSFGLSASGVERKLHVTLRRPACAAAIALGMMGDEGCAFASDVEKLLSEDSPTEVVASFIRALGMMGAVSNESKIRDYLNETSAPIRQAACFALGELAKVAEDAESAQAVADRLKDSNALVREAAAAAMGSFKIEGWQHVGDVAKLVGDKVGFVKVAALNSIGSLGNMGQMLSTEVARAIYEEAGDEKTRVTAINVLASMGDRGSAYAEDVATLLEDPNGLIRETALLALSKMGQEAVPFLPEVTKACSDPLESVRAAADTCVAALGG